MGDGINDAPALEQADLGIAVSRASDVAREAADIILLKSEIEAVPESLGLARATLRTIKQNLFWAFFYNAIGMPLAALGFMSPVLCAAAMGLSDLVVIGNALAAAPAGGLKSGTSLRKRQRTCGPRRRREAAPGALSGAARGLGRDAAIATRVAAVSAILRNALLFGRQCGADYFPGSSSCICDGFGAEFPQLPGSLLAIADDLLNAFALFGAEFQLAIQPFQKIPAERRIRGTG